MGIRNFYEAFMFSLETMATIGTWEEMYTLCGSESNFFFNIHYFMHYLARLREKKWNYNHVSRDKWYL